MFLKEDLTIPLPENANTSYSETTRTPSTSLYETTPIVSIDAEKIGSKGIIIIRTWINVSLLDNCIVMMFIFNMPCCDSNGKIIIIN